jgi:hypothetical protein
MDKLHAKIEEMENEVKWIKMTPYLERIRNIRIK